MLNRYLLKKPQKLLKLPNQTQLAQLACLRRCLLHRFNKGNASLAIRTCPEAACSITVTYANEISKDAGLLPKPADEFGVVQWTWTVESSRPVGKWPVDVTCGLGKESDIIAKN